MRNAELGEIMTKPVLTVREDAPFHEVADLFRQHNIRHVPVVDRKGILVGLVTQTDLFREASPRRTPDGEFFLPEDLDNLILARIMTRDPATLKANNSIADAIEHMLVGKYGCIPITDDDGKVAGIVTAIDLLKFASRTL